MGYKVSSFLSVSPNDSHRYFLYFICGSDFKHQKLNTIINESFHDIAERLGPNGVIISTFGKNGWDSQTESVLSNLTGLRENGCMFGLGFQGVVKKKSQPEDNTEMYFHNGEPYFIITTTPLDLESETKGLIINLSGLDKIDLLDQVIDVVIKSIQKNDLQFLIDNMAVWDKAYNKEELSTYTSMLELKPNIFGLGVNLNAVFDFIGRKIIQKEE